MFEIPIYNRLIRDPYPALRVPLSTFWKALLIPYILFVREIEILTVHRKQLHLLQLTRNSDLIFLKSDCVGEVRRICIWYEDSYLPHEVAASTKTQIKLIWFSCSLIQFSNCWHFFLQNVFFLPYFSPVKKFSKYLQVWRRSCKWGHQAWARIIRIITLGLKVTRQRPIMTKQQNREF